MMHSDSRVKEPVCLATTSLPDPCLSTYLSPRFREEPKKIPCKQGIIQLARCEEHLVGDVVADIAAWVAQFLQVLIERRQIII